MTDDIIEADTADTSVEVLAERTTAPAHHSSTVVLTAATLARIGVKTGELVRLATADETAYAVAEADDATEITVHEDTAEALSIISSRLDEVFTEHLKGRFEPDPEFHRELGETAERGIVSNDDVIRLGLCYATDLSEALTELEDNHEYLDIDQMFGDGALDLLKAFQAGVAATDLGDN